MEGPSVPLRTTRASTTASASASCCMSSAATSIALARTAGAAASEFVLEIAPFGSRQRLVEKAGIVAGVEHDLGAERSQRTPVWHLVLVDEVTAAHLDAIDREPRRDRVHQPLAHESAFEPARRAIGAARRLVREPHAPDRPISRQPARPR